MSDSRPLACGWAPSTMTASYKVVDGMVIMPTCSDIIVGDQLTPCECGKLRLFGKPHGWRAPGKLVGRVNGLSIYANENVPPDSYKVVID